MDIRFWAGAKTRCTVARWNSDADHEPWHKLYLPLDGSPRYAVARPGEAPRWTDLRPGQLYLIPGGRRHVNRCRSDFTLVWCHFTVQDEAMLAHLAALDRIVPLPIDLLPDCAERIAGCCGGEARRHAACALIHEVLARLPEAPADAQARLRRRLAGALFQLEYHFTRIQPISGLAQQAGLAPSRFQQLFRTAYGTSVHDYRLSLRIAEAKRLLVGGLPVQEVAVRCGYPNAFNFSRMFSSRCGLSPSAWRDQADRE